MTISRVVLLIAILVVGMVDPTRADGSDAELIARQGILAGIRGDDGLQQQLLATAIEEDTDCKLAQWYLGNVRVEDEWITIAEYEQRMATDPQLRAYHMERNAVSDGVQSEMHLGPVRNASGQLVPTSKNA